MTFYHTIKRLALSTVAAGMIIPSVAAAQNAVSLEGDIKVERTVIENGSSTTFLEEPSSVVPGDRLLFSTSYQNQSGETVEDFVVTNPLPSAIALAEEGDGFDVSVDGGETFGRLAQLTIADDNTGSRQASLGDVTHVRWVLERLESGATGSLEYYATVR